VGLTVDKQAAESVPSIESHTSGKPYVHLKDYKIILDGKPYYLKMMVLGSDVHEWLRRK
jgi:hypothetical protein